mmetsp:Transcript_19364/g.44893  ORF Transcript_19364/g.44893 Transcript_19364/m.44893 type:complete len:575 (-) Transcript_19364:575-2299(-)
MVVCCVCALMNCCAMVLVFFLRLNATVSYYEGPPWFGITSCSTSGGWISIRGTFGPFNSAMGPVRNTAVALCCAGQDEKRRCSCCSRWFPCLCHGLLFSPLLIPGVCGMRRTTVDLELKIRRRMGRRKCGGRRLERRRGVVAWGSTTTTTTHGVVPVMGPEIFSRGFGDARQGTLFFQAWLRKVLLNPTEQRHRSLLGEVQFVGGVGQNWRAPVIGGVCGGQGRGRGRRPMAELEIRFADRYRGGHRHRRRGRWLVASNLDRLVWMQKLGPTLATMLSFQALEEIRGTLNPPTARAEVGEGIALKHCVAERLRRGMRQSRDRSGSNSSHRSGGQTLGFFRFGRATCLGGSHVVEIGLGLNIRGLFVPRALYLLPLHTKAQLGASSQEELMVIRSSINALCESSESIQIQLSLKRGQLRLAEVLGHDLGDKLRRLTHEKGPPVGKPAHNGRIVVVIQHGVKLLRKRLGDPTSFLSHHVQGIRNIRIIVIDVGNPLLGGGSGCKRWKQGGSVCIIVGNGRAASRQEQWRGISRVLVPWSMLCRSRVLFAFFPGRFESTRRWRDLVSHGSICCRVCG